MKGRRIGHLRTFGVRASSVRCRSSAAAPSRAATRPRQIGQIGAGQVQPQQPLADRPALQPVQLDRDLLVGLRLVVAVKGPRGP